MVELNITLKNNGSVNSYEVKAIKKDSVFKYAYDDCYITVDTKNSIIINRCSDHVIELHFNDNVGILIIDGCNTTFDIKVIELINDNGFMVEYKIDDENYMFLCKEK